MNVKVSAWKWRITELTHDLFYLLEKKQVLVLRVWLKQFQDFRTKLCFLKAWGEGCHDAINPIPGSAAAAADRVLARWWINKMNEQHPIRFVEFCHHPYNSIFEGCKESSFFTLWKSKELRTGAIRKKPVKNREIEQLLLLLDCFPEELPG